MLQFLSWYVAVTLLGLLTFPLAYRLLPALPDRGYALSRSLGLLLWAFIFWLAVSLGLAQNNTGGLLLTLAVLAGLAVWANWHAARSTSTSTTSNLFQPVIDWLRANLRYVGSVEILFLVAFALMAFIRACNPDLTTTEKPMEIAFINAIIHSPTFPPHDPWLSGYAISYYYFGYVMVAMLAEITSTVGSIAFNLMLALVFGLGAIGAYGLVYNLLQAYWQSHPEQAAAKNRLVKIITGALLAPLFLLILGNWEGLLEILHTRGIGWGPGTGHPGDVNFWTNLGVGYPPTDASPAPYNFWTWLNMLDLKDQPRPVMGGVFERLAGWWNAEGVNGLVHWINEAFMPGRGGWWWWRASRVITDYDLAGHWNEIIDEFPAFSFILGDLHPHVLAMPFGLLAGALALNLYLGGWKGETKLFKTKLPNDNEFELKLPVRLEGFLLLAVTLGGMAFLNTWAFPIYLGLVCIVLVLTLAQERGWDWDLVEDFLKFSIPLALLSVILYLPFYIGFSSQAGGVLPNVVWPSRATHLWVMFGGLFVPIFIFLLFLRGKEPSAWRIGFLLSIGFVLLLWAFSTVLGLITANTDVGQQFITMQGSSSAWGVLGQAALRRLAFGGSLLTLVLLIGGAVAYLVVIKPQVRTEQPETESVDTPRSPIPFVLLLILFGGLLVLGPEFVYLRDQFGNRMNTVFKFYYEAWALWSIAATFGIVFIFSELRSKPFSIIYSVVVVALVAIGLIYPGLGFPYKTDNFLANNPELRTLDGVAYLERYNPNEYAAIQFLEKAEPGTLVEAVGNSYHAELNLASTYSGKPTVLGWDYHESQWRGGEKEKGSRRDDVMTLYITHDWAQAQEILSKYGIRYVYIGPHERETYNAIYEEKFTQHLSAIYQQGDVTIYLVP